MTLTSPPDPIAILLAEHVQAYALFAAFEAALNGIGGGEPAAGRQALDAAETLLAFLDGGLELHIRKEEEPLFPRLKAALPADDRLIDEMVAEHDQARLKREALRATLDEVLGGHDHGELRREREELRAAAVAAARAPAAADLAALRQAGRAVLQTLRVHFQNEEEIVFPLAPDLLTPDELRAAGAEMVALDEQHHLTISWPAGNGGA